MYRDEEKLCLKWNDFQENAISAFGTLREDREFADVTLACEDGQQVEAHKVILASSSPFFLNLLRRNNHPHPLIYMRGVKSEDLVAMIDFLYYGEAKLYQESIDSFLAIAEELNLKGLTGKGKTEDNKDIKAPPGDGAMPNRTLQTKVQLASSEHISDLQILNERTKSMMTKQKNVIPSGRDGQMLIIPYMCKVCGKEATSPNNIKEHIEAKHLDGIALPCTYCTGTFGTRATLRKHTNNYHKSSVNT